MSTLSPARAGSIAALGVASVLLAGCPSNADRENAAPPAGRVAVAQLSPTQGNQAQGMVTFIQEEDGVRVVADLRNVPPGKHGMHVHENGDCSAPDASSAGGHFNPTGAPHAGPDAEKRHVGDMGNVTAGADGNVNAEWVDKHLAFDGQASVIGRSVVLHAGPDDLTSQPSGSSGARIACGKIEFEQQ